MEKLIKQHTHLQYHNKHLFKKEKTSSRTVGPMLVERLVIIQGVHL